MQTQTSERKHNFKLFRDVGLRGGLNIVRIGEGGYIFLNSGFRMKADVAQYPYVRLHYDEDTNTMGMEFVDDETLPGIIKVTKQGVIGFSARTFFMKNNIQLSDVVGRFKPVELNENDSRLWLIDLNKTLEEEQDGTKEDGDDDDQIDLEEAIKSKGKGKVFFSKNKKRR